MRSEDLRALLELRLTPGIGDVRLRRLLHRHASPAAALAVLRQDPDAAFGWNTSLVEPGDEDANVRSARRWRPPVEGVRERRIRADRVDRAEAAIRALRIHVLINTQRRYPARLRQLHDPPAVLFARGELELLHMPGVAVVGSRVHTEYGASTTTQLAGALARAGVVVISGLARGIDRVAHEAALAVGGRTVAVLGCGPDVVYPAENEPLHRGIAEAGLLVSELPPGEPALAHHFPKRNRILAALGHAVVVVEAGVRSGALITARDAIDLGREVFAVPGPIGRSTSEGTNELIQSLNAHLLTSADEILRSMREEKPPPHITPLAARGSCAHEVASRGTAHSGTHEPILSLITGEAAPVEEVAVRSGMTAGAALVALLELELQGRVHRLPGMRFGRAT